MSCRVASPRRVTATQARGPGRLRPISYDPQIGQGGWLPLR
jgi:hypothetical protein